MKVHGEGPLYLFLLIYYVILDLQFANTFYVILYHKVIAPVSPPPQTKHLLQQMYSNILQLKATNPHAQHFVVAKIMRYFWQ